MRTHTLLTKAASIAVCFGILLSGPASAFAGGNSTIIRDVELSADGTLYGRVFTSEGQSVQNAQIELRYKGTSVARTVTVADGQFAVTGVRGGVHDVAVGSLTTQVRLWKNGTAPEGALDGIIVSGSENVVRGQACDMYGNPCDPCNTCPPSSGFGLIDVVTLAMLGTAAAGLVIAIDNNNQLDDLQQQLASP